jgi:hypothetical protein
MLKIMNDFLKLIITIGFLNLKGCLISELV